MHLSRSPAAPLPHALSSRRFWPRSALVVACGIAAANAAFTPAITARAAHAAQTDARFGKLAYTAPDPATWRRSDGGGRATYATALPPPDFCTITFFPTSALSGDFKGQFAEAVRAELKRLGVLKIDGAQPLQEKKSGGETTVAAQVIGGETAGFHTFHSFIAFRIGGQFQMLAFQTSGAETYKAHVKDFQVLVSGLHPASAPVGAIPAASGGPAIARPAAQTAAGTATSADALVNTPAKAPRLPPLARRPGYVVGRAVFADGRPVPKFEVSVGGFDASADASRGVMPSIGFGKATNGRYAVQVRDSFSHTKPVDARVASVTAVAHVAYQGHEYKLEMRDLGGPTGLTTYLGQARAGVVRDFVLPLSGFRPGYTEADQSETRYRNACYGGLLTVDGSISNKPDVNSEDETALTRAFPQGTVELTLTPTGPLVDGSTGQAIRLTAPVSVFRLSGDWHRRVLRGVPIGVYTATARLLLPGGASRPLRIKDDIRTTAAWHSSLPVTWAPVERFANLSTDIYDTPTLYLAQ